ncbi:MAG: hypothetical protein HFF06_07410 [Oscillospiraceae bacterium]|jgi:predicted transcriptional regulator YheO|nr:hypothetical protein [Oscillospiraceae bacterium]
MSEQMALTPVDRAILESYKAVLDGFSSYFGEGYEMVLHSLEDYDHSVIKIVNGYHTSRVEGAPITDLALSMLEKIRSQGGEPKAVTYFTQNRRGEPLKSSTIPILGEGGRIIGLLCMNFYLNTPFRQVIGDFVPLSTEGGELHAETFTDNVDELIGNAVAEVRRQVEADEAVTASNKNKEMVRRLEAKGIFNLKDGVAKAAQALRISKNTVYLHLRNLK